MDNSKASNISVIDLKKRTSIADYFIIATCRSSRHANATAEEMTNKFENSNPSWWYRFKNF